jgi:uncharacterized protein (TIGR02284 family)
VAAPSGCLASVAACTWEETMLDQPWLDHLKSLHTAAIDARNGYQEALKDAEGQGMTPLFRELIALHEGHAAALARQLAASGETPDDKGSFMTTVHKAIMDIRSLFNGLGESVLPGLIDGEKRNVSKYDTALRDGGSSRELATLLTGQRSALVRKIAELEARQAASKSSAA